MLKNWFVKNSELKEMHKQIMHRNDVFFRQIKKAMHYQPSIIREVLYGNGVEAKDEPADWKRRLVEEIKNDIK